ncbi:DNA polymerase III subunit delta [Sphingomonas sp.]|uniref:DNA polymerase III subunit delta n=1 Tax=Sphingomonas sp. TaxID=28214 RepID=UPI003B00289F
MIATNSRLDPAIRPGLRCSLFYGSDEPASRELAAGSVKALGSAVERIDLHATQLKSDPSLLVDEAAALSLFGAARYVRVDGVVEDCLPAIEALLSAPQVGSPVILVAGALKKNSQLLHVLGNDPHSRVIASHPVEAPHLRRLAIALAASHGLRIDDDAAESLVEMVDGNRELLAREIEKLSIYVDASSETPRRANEEAIAAMSIDQRGANIGVVVDAFCSRDLRSLLSSEAQLSRDGSDDVLLVRSLLKRLVAMAAAKAEIGRGASARSAIDRVTRAMFWRERESIAADLPEWTCDRLSWAIELLGKAERALKSGRGAGSVGLRQLIATIARSTRQGDVRSARR